jgi:hypothetical protein
MKRSLVAAAFLLAVTSQAFASYIVVLKDGTQYKAKQRWTVSDGKALVALAEGGVLQLDPSLIDQARTDEVNRLGLGNVKVLAVESAAPGPSTPERSTLGSITKLRRPESAPAGNQAPEGRAAAPVPPPTTASAAGALGPEVLMKFEAAYENVGVFDHRVSSPGPKRIVAYLTTDTEERVFSAITATAFFMLGVPRSTGQEIDLVEIYMQTTTGAAAGRFHMSRTDAEALNSKKLSPSNYFVQKVLY